MKAVKRVRVSEIKETWESLSGWYWYITEYHGGTKVFGLVQGYEIEWCYFDLAQLRELGHKCKAWPVPKEYWASCPGVIDDAASYSRVPGKNDRQEAALPAYHPRDQHLKGGEQKMADEFNNNK